MTELIGKNIKPIILILVGIIGAVMIFVSGNTENTDDKENAKEHCELDAYAAELEKKLTDIVENIDGAGEAKVMITFESSFERVYAGNVRFEENGTGAVDTSTAKTTEKQIVLAGQGTSGETPILLKELCPKVKGVVVVCSGAGNESVVRSIKDTVSVLFGIGDYKVCVTGGS